MDADYCWVGALGLAGEELCFEDEERWSGVTVIAKEVEGGAEAIGSRSWGGSTAAGVAGVEVMGSGAMGEGGDDVCGAGIVAESSAREPRTVEMTRLASMGAGYGAEDVTTARVATSDTGVGAGGSVVAEDRKSTRLNSSHITRSRMPSSA